MSEVSTLRVASSPTDARRSTPMQPTVSAAQLAARLGLPAPTPEQRDVIEAPSTSMLVVAGAGSGKTETMAARVVWLVANGLVDPCAVLGLTFTRKAARELRERVTRRLEALGADGRPASDLAAAAPDVQTYHGYAGSLLAEYGMLAGLEPDLRLLSAAGAWQLAHEVVTAYGGPMDEVDLAPPTVTRAVLSLSDELAEHLCDLEQAAAWCDDVTDVVGGLPAGRGRGVPAPVRRMLDRTSARRQILGVVAAYRAAKRDRRCLDFADQLTHAARLVTTLPRIAERERARRRLVLLDEFQDTSAAQLAMLHALFGAGGAADQIPVIAVGDPHQSIYGWRGAGADTLGRFARTFAVPDGSLPIRSLSTSWRNSERVLAVANRVAAPLTRTTSVPVRRLVPAPAATSGLVDVARCADPRSEAALVARWIAKHRAGSSRAPDMTDLPSSGVHDRLTAASVPGVVSVPPLRSAAVLCRRREQIPVVAGALRAAGLPVEEVGVGGLVSTPEVAYLIAALTVTHDPDRNDAAMFLLMQPPVRLGAADLDAVGAWARERAGHGDRGDRETPPPSLVDAIVQPPRRGWRGPEGERLGESARRRLSLLGGSLARLSSLATLPLCDLVHAAERVLGIDVEVAARSAPGLAAGSRHLRRFAQVVAEFAATTATTATTAAPSLGTLLDWLEAARDQEGGLALDPGPVDPDCVQVLTVHAAKGLEWDVVAIPGLVEGSFPFARAGGARYREGGWQISAPCDPGWTNDVGSLPYELRADGGSLPALGWRRAGDLTELRAAINEFAERNAEHGLAEERRLMYVAMTRARSAALLTAPVWTEGAAPRVTSRFLQELLRNDTADLRPHAVPGFVRVLEWEPMPGDPAEARPPLVAGGDSSGGGAERPCAHEEGRACVERNAAGQTPGSGAVNRPPGESSMLAPYWPADEPLVVTVAAAADRVRAWQRGDGAMPSEAEPIPEFSDLDHRIAILLAERDEATHREAGGAGLAAGSLTASVLVGRHRDPIGQAEQAARPIPRKPLTGSRTGRAWHRWIERYYRSGGLFDLLGMPGTDGAPLDGPMGEAAAASDHVDASTIAAFLKSPWANRVPVALELPVDLLVAGVPVRGRIDAVFRDGPDGFVVVDWKTGRPRAGAAAAAQTLQLAVYRTAYARLAGVPVERVRACFCYATDGSTVYPPLPQEQLLEVFVATAARL